ncbi:MAG: polysaccharide deacetylase family protein [Kaiparowitsia implicata GSE-PSE-MK54-09C]|jgi:peptidoglycan/xylan/chitin deacetylase (PgdA/CDA1 family)|nr:polysaccharide deacetylase family protein [Kaiparowitsia implicata GSE-PSE-MK54-09C]
MEFALFYPYLHQILKPTFPACLWSGSSGKRVVALTFDDGPHPRHTQPLLDLLDDHQISASFFLLGQCVDHAPEVARAIYQRGHWMGLHGYTHRSFPMLTNAEIRTSLEKTQEAIARACHLDLSFVQQAICDVRPPNGLFTPPQLQRLDQWGFRPVMWSVVPEDWVRPGIEVVVGRVMSQVCDGSLIVLHDGYCGGEDVRAIAARIIPLLKAQGYEFVTIDELWQNHPTHGPRQSSAASISTPLDAR